MNEVIVTPALEGASFEVVAQPHVLTLTEQWQRRPVYVGTPLLPVVAEGVEVGPKIVACVVEE